VNGCSYLFIRNQALQTESQRRAGDGTNLLLQVGPDFGNVDALASSCAYDLVATQAGQSSYSSRPTFWVSKEPDVCLFHRDSGSSVRLARGRLVYDSSGLYAVDVGDGVRIKAAAVMKCPSLLTARIPPVD
jgi:hypothetical protein